MKTLCINILICKLHYHIFFSVDIIRSLWLMEAVISKAYLIKQLYHKLMVGSRPFNSPPRPRKLINKLSVYFVILSDTNVLLNEWPFLVWPAIGTQTRRLPIHCSWIVHLDTDQCILILYKFPSSATKFIFSV
jgi:hypothetical protein